MSHIIIAWQERLRYHTFIDGCNACSRQQLQHSFNMAHSKPLSSNRQNSSSTVGCDREQLAATKQYNSNKRMMYMLNKV